MGTHMAAPNRAPASESSCLSGVTHTRHPSKRRALALCPLALAACFGEAPVPGGGDDTDDGSSAPTEADTGTAPTGDPSTASMSSTEPTGASDSNSSSSTSNSSTTADPSETDATTIEPETEGPPCGAMGEACCEADACEEGACLLGTCVAFAGVFMDGEQCPSCPSVLQALSCGCPDGFDIAPALPLLSSGCIKDSPEPWTDESVYVCQASTYVPGVSDWGGAYLRNDAAAGCEGVPACVVANPYTRDCNCPAESTPVEAVVYGHCDGEIPEPPPAFRLTFCIGNAPPLTFGGVVYSESPTCIVPHPETGSCACPEELTLSSLRVISQAVPTNMAGDLGFCVRAP
jgi:hypothetical protein